MFIFFVHGSNVGGRGLPMAIFAGILQVPMGPAPDMIVVLSLTTVL
jgi:hypothetical protein